MARYEYKPFAYNKSPEFAGGRGQRWPVAIVGAGPIGLSAAIDLALHGIRCVVLDDNNVVSRGSRAICWSKRTLEIFDRLGVGERMVKKGVTWKVGRLYHGDREVYAFDLLPEAGHKNPAFINLQQYYVEQYLVERCLELPELIELRFMNKVGGLEQHGDGVRAQVETPDGTYTIEADYLIACDGAKSAVRAMLGVAFTSHIFPEQFLITDVEMKADFPSERRFWFEPTFHNGQSALLHKQPDDIYRIDLQLTPDADAKEEVKPENVIPRIKAAIGDRPFEIDWVSLYTFQCGRIERFVHGRVIFAGDSAHVVSPFGARGGNGGIQDVDNLAWKLAAVIKGTARAALLATYDEERIHGADENIRNSSHSTNFMTPKNAFEHMLRDEVLGLAETYPFARRLVNSGRLSLPCTLAGFALQSPDDPAMNGAMGPGTACTDAPVRDARGQSGWLLDHLGGDFVVMSFGRPAPVRQDVRRLVIASEPVAGVETLCDESGLLALRYGGREGAAYLIRPDQHVAARFAEPTADKIAAAWAKAGQVKGAEAAWSS
jgi:3-(3-hydroxy-phenyl)propionate hydroxylase